MGKKIGYFDKTLKYVKKNWNLVKDLEIWKKDWKFGEKKKIGILGEENEIGKKFGNLKRFGNLKLRF